MSVKIKVDIQVKLDKIYDELTAVLEEGMRDLMMTSHGVWQDMAAAKLHSTQRDYQDAIQHKIVDPFTVHLFLSHNDAKKNWLVNALEIGHGPMLPWRSTLADRKSFYWSPQAKWPNKYKWHSYAEGYKSPTDKKPRKARKPPGGYKPFMDVPNWGKDTPRSGSKPSAGGGRGAYSRLTAATSGKWTHKGFKPIGKGGLERPLREYVIDHVKEKAPKLFRELIEQVVKG